jgi:hypothetical protein
MESLFGEPGAQRVVPADAKQKQPSVLTYANASRGSAPGRGLLYSFLVHEVAIFGLLFVAAHQPLPHETPPPELTQIVDLNQPKGIIYLPPLGGGSEGKGQAKVKADVQRKRSPAAGAASKKGFSFPGPQEILSNPPKPTNRIQTILQPGLANPPALKVPIALPNVVRMTEAEPVPMVEPAKPAPPVAAEAQPKPPPPVQPQAQTSAPVLPILPKVEPVATPPAEPPKLELPAVTTQNSSLVAQAIPPAPAAKPVEKPVESPAPKQVSPLPTHGTDQQNLLVLSPMPAPPEKSAKLPAGEAQGHFAISPEPNTASSMLAPGSQVENSGPSAIGVANKAGPPAGNVAGESGPGIGSEGTGEGEGSGKGGTGMGRGSGTGSGSGTGAGAGPGRGAFPGITIQGGSLTGGTSKPGQPTGSPVAPQTSYGLTIVATGSSGGGLADFGVFFDEQVYTVYIDMRRTTGDPAPSWVLQYAVLHKAAAQAGAAGQSGQNQQGLVPPFPVVKEPPQLPTGLVFRYLHRMVVVYAIINTEGKLERMHVMQTPTIELNKPLLEALGKWVFRPAELNGEAVSVKILLGIPLSMPE